MSSPNNEIRNRLIALAEPVCTDAGYDLVDLQYVREQGGWVVRVFIEGATEESIGFDDCERVSRDFSAVLDVEDPITSAYSLEVSSPGLDRPLRRADHFQRFAGHVAKIVLRDGVEGRRNFKGVVEGFDSNSDAIVVKVDQQSYSLPLSDLRSAKLVPDWDEVLKANSARKEQAR